MCSCATGSTWGMFHTVSRLGTTHKAFLFAGSERAGHVATIYYSVVESRRSNKVNPLTYLTYILSNARNRGARLPTPDEFAEFSAGPAGGCTL